MPETRKNIMKRGVKKQKNLTIEQEKFLNK